MSCQHRGLEPGQVLRLQGILLEIVELRRDGILVAQAALERFPAAPAQGLLA
jgi:hypothetical protein